MASAYVTGLRMLGRRELCEAQVRTRLTRRQFDADEIEEAIARLLHERALDDRRTALACARTEAHLKHHGRRRALQQLEALGIDRDLAREAVAEVFADLDEDELIAQALTRRLRHESLEAATAVRRVHRYLLAQGFDAARVHAALRNRATHASHDD
ncbi:MAG: RecX family transcriptional regulator [Acidobacteria bacterium]|nr:RecX family transcriptional regulator [Acidobacteriota bacterium]